MQIHITARHLSLTPSISDYIEKKVSRLQHYFDHLISAQVVVTVDKIRHTAIVDVHGAGKTFRGRAEAGDLYAAIDLATEKLHHQLHRYKEKVKVHRPEKRKYKRLSLRENIGAFIAADPKELASEYHDGLDTIKSVQLLPMRVRDALNAMEKERSRFWLFVHEESGRVCVIYRRSNGRFGLLETV